MPPPPAISTPDDVSKDDDDILGEMVARLCRGIPNGKRKLKIQKYIINTKYKHMASSDKD